MNHVFYIHSPLTEKVSLSVIEKLKIEDPVFVVENRYKTDKVEAVSIENIYRFGKTNYNVAKRWKEILRGDRKLSSIVGEKFHLYAPQTTLKQIRLIISHRLCTKFSIVEEGLTSYCTREEINSKVSPEKESIARKIAYMGRLGERNFFRQGYERMYGISEKSFPGYERVSTVEVEFGSGSKNNVKSGECILVLDSLKYYSKEASCCYIITIQEVIKYAKKKYDKINFKMHPDSYENWQEDIFRRIIGSGASSAKEIGRSKFLEDIAIGVGVDVLVNVSATGLYCGLFSDGNVYSFYKMFESTLSPGGQEGKSEITDEFDWVPEIYWENVQQLELD